MKHQIRRRTAPASRFDCLMLQKSCTNWDVKTPSVYSGDRTPINWCNIFSSVWAWAKRSKDDTTSFSNVRDVQPKILRISCFSVFFSVRKASIMHSCSESNQRCERACDLFTRAANKLKETFSSWWNVPMVFPTLNFHDMKHLADLRWSWCKPRAARTTTPTKDSNHHVGECLWSSRIPLLGGRVDTINEKEIPICSFFVSSQFSRRWKNERSHFWPIYWIPYAPNTAGS